MKNENISKNIKLDFINKNVFDIYKSYEYQKINSKIFNDNSIYNRDYCLSNHYLNIFDIFNKNQSENSYITNLEKYLSSKYEYSITDIYTVFLVFILIINSDFTSFIKDLNNDKIQEILKNTLKGKNIFLVKIGKSITLRTKNINNSLVGGNSINLSKLFNSFFPKKKINNFTGFLLTTDDIDEYKGDLELGIGKTLYELIGIFREIQGQNKEEK